MKNLTVVIALGGLLSALPCFGQHAEEAHAHGQAHGHKHHLALYLGNTHDYHGEDAFTVGLDYEFRLTERLGLGAFVDHATGDIEATVAGVALFVHPLLDFTLLAGAGNEHHHGEDTLVVRLGIAYAFEVSGFSIAPTVNADLFEGEHVNWLYGIGIGRGF